MLVRFELGSVKIHKPRNPLVVDAVEREREKKQAKKQQAKH